MNRLFAAILTVATASLAAAEERGQLDASPTLFAVMAAMDASGMGIDAASPSNHPLRAAVRAELAKRNIPSLPQLKRFFELQKQKGEGLELSRYISWGLSAGPPPRFVIGGRDIDLPPDVTGLSGLSELIAAFWKEGDLDDLWRRSQPAIEQYLQRYHAGVSGVVLEVNAYLRQPTSGFTTRRFQVFVELLAPPNQIQTRSYGNADTIVLTPSAEPQIHDVRHAYLHYLIEPMTTRNQEIVERKRGLIDHAQRAPALSENYKNDFLLLTSESLIRAIEARLDRKPAEATEALREGYILTPYFYESLATYEKAEDSMSFYYPAMIKALELKKEDARLQTVEFAKEARKRQVKSPAAPPAPPPLTGAAKTLEEAEQLYTARSLDQAKEKYLAVLRETDSKPVQAAAYYGLARIAVLGKDPETAERLFQKSLESSPEPQVKGWVLVYLGRLAMAAAEREQAEKFFRDALAVGGASAAARQAAEQGLRAGSGAPAPGARQ